MSSPLRDTQLIARAHLAAFFASANVVAALILAASLFGHVALPLLLGWGAAVVVGNLAALKLARTQAITHVGRAGRKVPANAHGRRSCGPCASVPVAADLLLLLACTRFADRHASIVAGLGVAALGLVVVPICVTAWMSCFVGGSASSCCLRARRSLEPCHADPLHAWRRGVRRGNVARWALGQLETNADVGSQSASASLLLQEYEQRGVGWLWQVDADNRVPTSVRAWSPCSAARHPRSSVIRSLFAWRPRRAWASPAWQTALQCARNGIADCARHALDRNRRRSDHRHGGPFRRLSRRRQRHHGGPPDAGAATHLANVDVLSGLPNRGRVRQLLGEAVRQAISSNVPCAIMFLDLDGFKPVNDTFGHPKGDAVLQAVAKRLCDEAAADGHVGRMGGDEFAIVVTDAQSRLKVEGLAERIIKSIAEPYMIDQTEIRIGVSIGCAFGPIDGATVDDLILKADLALYEAKGAGRGVIKYFSSELQSEQEDRAQLESDLRTAIVAKQFHLVYQPLVEAKTQKLVGFEALIRWNHPKRGLIPPPVFIPVAEECGLMLQLGQWVIEEAVRAAATWPDIIGVAINISPKQIVAPSLPNIVSQALARHRVQGNRIEL
jgi:diguanylate cyclase (GGDEF)-like protein